MGWSNAVPIHCNGWSTTKCCIQRSIRQFDSLAVNYLAAYWLATSLPGLTLNFAELLYDYGRPQVKDPALVQSLDELYRLEVKDSTRIRAAIQTLKKAGNTAVVAGNLAWCFRHQSYIAGMALRFSIRSLMPTGEK